MSRKKKVQAEEIEQPVEEVVEQITPTPEEAPVETIDHVLTQEDLDANPELVEQGLEVGDMIQLPADAEVLPEEEVAEEPAPEADEVFEAVEEVSKEPENVPVPDRPSWVDARLWDGLSPERKLRLVNGENWR